MTVSSYFASYLVNKLTNRTVSTSVINKNDNDQIISATELDSHADSPVVGKYAIIIETTDKKAMVSGFTSDLGEPMKVPIVISSVAYDCKYTGLTHIMVIHNALYLENMTVNLIPPIMMRIAGIDVNECPKFLAKSTSDEDHSLFFPDADLRIPLLL